MAEFSGTWTTGTSGDGTNTYTQAQASGFFAVLAACSGFEGVAPGYLSELLCAANGANSVRVSPGGGVVDGKVHTSSANVDVNIPSAVGGGNTRIDRLVLRAVWASYTVRITRIAGTDAASPTAPAITQTSGTTYDISLCTVLVTTAGAVTVTDARVWAATGAHGLADGILAATAAGRAKMADLFIITDKILDDQITQAKIGPSAVGTTELTDDAVTAAKIGTMVPALLGRQGGSASNWLTQGTNNYTSGINARVQCGSISSGTAQAVVTFPVAFSDKPIVLVTGIGCTPFLNVLGAVTATQATIDNPAGGAFSAFWIAIGPE